MISKSDLTHFAAETASSPAVAKIVATATPVIGISTYFEWLSKGIGIAASVTGLLLALALYRKAKKDTRNTDLLAEKLQLEIQRMKEEN